MRPMSNFLSEKEASLEKSREQRRMGMEIDMRVEVIFEVFFLGVAIFPGENDGRINSTD